VGCAAGLEKGTQKYKEKGEKRSTKREIISADRKRQGTKSAELTRTIYKLKESEQTGKQEKEPAGIVGPSPRAKKATVATTIVAIWTKKNKRNRGSHLPRDRRARDGGK